MQVVCKFTRGDGADMSGGNSTSTPVNNILHSLFTEINVSLNGKVVTPGTDTYPYKAYFEKKTLVVLPRHPQNSDESMYVMGKRHGKTLP
jgi:hypothetical protein